MSWLAKGPGAIADAAGHAPRSTSRETSPLGRKDRAALLEAKVSKARDTTPAYLPNPEVASQSRERRTALGKGKRARQKMGRQEFQDPSRRKKEHSPGSAEVNNLSK